MGREREETERERERGREVREMGERERKREGRERERERGGGGIPRYNLNTVDPRKAASIVSLHIQGCTHTATKYGLKL